MAGYFLFQPNLEGFIYFKTLGESFYQLFILLTTANFPDVMLPAYNSNRIYALFFVGYLIFGLYFLQNILQAIIFDNYKRRIREKCEVKTDSRVDIIE